MSKEETQIVEDVINAVPNEYEFQESSWDVMALIGVPCIGYGDACLGAFANFAAVLMQFFFCIGCVRTHDRRPNGS